jgi:carbonyl reductase 1
MTPSGRVAVVTGSNKGIGYFIALQLGLSGLFEHILLACRDANRAQEAVKSIQEQVPKNVHVSSASLTLGDTDSHAKFAKEMEETFGKVDVLVNNAGFAYKNADPTPFKEQCKKTLNVNFYGTVDLTHRLLPLIRKGSDPRVVSVASMAGRLSQVSKDLQKDFSSPQLTMDHLMDLMQGFVDSVADGTHRDKGYGNSNYGMSKLGVIAATRIWAQQEKEVKFYSCCPGYCKTDMSSQGGDRDPADGAKNAVIPATMKDPPKSGAFFQNYEEYDWTKM